MWLYREKKARMISPEVDNGEFIARKSARKKQIDISGASFAAESAPPAEARHERPSARQLAPKIQAEPEVEAVMDSSSGSKPYQHATPSKPMTPRSGIRPAETPAPPKSDTQNISTPPEEPVAPSTRMQAQDQPSGSHDSRRSLTGGSTEGAPRRIGDMLIKYKLINQQQLDEALAAQKAMPEHKLLGQVLIELGVITEMQLTIAIAKLCQIPFLQITKYNVNAEAIGKLSGHVCRRLQVLPLDILGKILTIAMVNPFDYAAIREAEFHTSMKIKRVICLLKDLEECFELFYPETEQPALPAPEGMEGETAEEEVPEISPEIEETEAPPQKEITSDLDNLFAEAEERIRTSIRDRKSIEKKAPDLVGQTGKIQVDRESLADNPSIHGVPLGEQETWELFRKSPLYKFDKKMESFLSASVLKAPKVEGEIFELVSEVIK